MEYIKYDIRSYRITISYIIVYEMFIRELLWFY